MLPQKGKSLKEWVKIYEEKTGDKAELPAGYRLFYLAERGFASMKPSLEDKMMVVYQVCGDAKFWRDHAELYAATMGLDYVASICTRHIKPYIRGFGWSIISEQCINGQYRFNCQDSIGRKVIITHKDINDITGEPEYWVTHYLNEKATESLNFAPKGGGTDVENTEETV